MGLCPVRAREAEGRVRAVPAAGNPAWVRARGHQSKSHTQRLQSQCSQQGRGLPLSPPLDHSVVTVGWG